MSLPKVSICIATHNGEQFITEAINSIKLQTYENFEVIIVDDHSTDNTVKILYDLCDTDNRFKIFTNITNIERPYYDAHNKSYKLAQGELLVRFDQDDIMTPCYIEKMVNYMDEHQDITTACCYVNELKNINDKWDIDIESSKGYLEDSTKELIDLIEKYPIMYFWKISLDKVFPIWYNNATIIRKKFLEDNDIKYNCTEYGDFVFWLNVTSHGGTFAVVREYLFNYRIHMSSTSHGLIYNNLNNAKHQYFIAKYKHLSFLRYGEDSVINGISLNEPIAIFKNTMNFFKDCLEKENRWEDIEKEINEDIMDDLYHFTTNNIDTYFHKDLSDKDKYIVCTCARGENDYIVEYVNHYLNLGFDKIIICDNNDDASIEDVLKNYIENRTVEIFNCRKFGSFQVQFYAMFCTEGNYKWCAYFDADEFLELGVYSNIKEFLETINEDAICFNWLMFGSNGQYHKTEGTIQERFPQPVKPILMYKENVFFKSILRGGYNRFQNVWFNGSHVPVCSNKVTYNIGGMHVIESNGEYQSHTVFPPKYRCGYLKHYYTKSFDEWIKKSSRGWPDGTPTLATSNYFSCENYKSVPIQKQVMSLFIDENHLEEFPTSIKEILDTYDVIQFNNSTKQVYSLYSQFMSVMNHTTNHTFILAESHIDDSLFAIFLEYAYETGNRLVFARNQDEVWKTYLKYSNKQAGTYYIFDLK